MFPPCNLSGSVCFEADDEPDGVRRRMEASLGIVFDDDSSEAGEYSYRASAFGFVIRLRVDRGWASGVLCRFSAVTDGNLGLLDLEAEDVSFDRHLAGLVEVNRLGRLISLADVQRIRAAAALGKSS
jgi:hypothetical protein